MHQKRPFAITRCRSETAVVFILRSKYWGCFASSMIAFPFCESSMFLYCENGTESAFSYTLITRTLIKDQEDSTYGWPGASWSGSGAMNEGYRKRCERWAEISTAPAPLTRSICRRSTVANSSLAMVTFDHQLKRLRHLSFNTISRDLN